MALFLLNDKKILIHHDFLLISTSYTLLYYIRVTAFYRHFLREKPEKTSIL